MFISFQKDFFSCSFENLAEIKTLFAFSSQFGSTTKYNNLLSNQFTKKCQQFAEKNPNFEFKVTTLSLDDPKSTENVLKSINDFDHIVLSAPIHAGSFASSMSKFLTELSNKKPQKLMISKNCALAVCGRAVPNSRQPNLLKELEAASPEEKTKILEERRIKTTQDYVIGNLKKKITSKPLLDSFIEKGICDVLPGEMRLEKLGFAQKLFFKYIFRATNYGIVDEKRANGIADKLFEEFIEKPHKN